MNRAERRRQLLSREQREPGFTPVYRQSVTDPFSKRGFVEAKSGPKQFRKPESAKTRAELRRKRHQIVEAKDNGTTDNR